MRVVVTAVGGCALVVTLTSLVIDPHRPVFFGILHSITVCSLLALPLTRLPAGACGLLSLPLLAMGWFFQHPMFDGNGWLWLGLSTQTPASFDHQPLLPWLGVVIGGLAVGKLGLLDRNRPWSQWQSRSWLSRGLALWGRHSLLVYMAHVPVLLGCISLIRWRA